MEEILPPITAQTTGYSPQMKVAIVCGLIISFVFSFAGGYFLSNTLRQEHVVLTTPSSTPLPSPPTIPDTDEPKGPITPLVQGKPQKYFLDTVFVVEKAIPHRTLIASVSRNETEQGYLQNNRASYFDGTTWDRQVHALTTSDSSIAQDDIIKSWDLQIDSSRVLQEKVTGEISVHQNQIKFDSETLTNEIGMRSLPDYTKFMSEGSGTVTIGDTQVPAYILYTKIYTMDASKIQFYSDPMGVTTDWVAFWDKNGNFYHIDTTQVDKPSAIYQTHQISVWKSIVGAVTKSFHVDVTRDDNKLPEHITIKSREPIDRTLKLTRTSMIDKSIPNKYNWYMMTVEGSVTDSRENTIPGFGLFEYIRDLE